MYSYVARQPIVDREQKLFAYELLFRNTEANTFPKVNPDAATSSIIADNELTMGLKRITDNKLAFINFPTDILIYKFPEFSEPSTVVIEILEDVTVSQKLIDTLKSLSEKGYTFALDDFDFNEQWLPLIPYVKIIKVDIKLVSIMDCIKQMRRDEYKNITWLAEKIETKQEFSQYLSLGFTYFQGYYFSPPEMIKKNKVTLPKNIVIELMALVSSDNVDYKSLEALFSKDVTLTYKLLRFLNNAHSQLTTEIESVRHALAYLGEQEVKKYIMLLVIANLVSDDKKNNVLLESLQRAKFCEIILTTPEDKKLDDKAFLIGMLSQIDIILGYPILDVLDLLPLHPEIKNALIKVECKRSIALQLAIATEKKHEETIQVYCKKLHIECEKVNATHNYAKKWAKSII